MHGKVSEMQLINKRILKYITQTIPKNQINGKINRSTHNSILSLHSNSIYDRIRLLEWN